MHGLLSVPSELGLKLDIVKSRQRHHADLPRSLQDPGLSFKQRVLY